MINIKTWQERPEQIYSGNFFTKISEEERRKEEVQELRERITQLETELAEAREDQSRYLETVKLYISGDLPLQLDTAESKKEFDLTIDAAIKDQQ